MPAESVQESPSSPVVMQKSSGWLRAGFWICTVIAAAVALRRLFATIHPPKNVPAQLAALDSFFVSHPGLTLAHILPALAFVCVAPFVVLRSQPSGGVAERLLFPLGGIVGITAYAMSIHSYGGWPERAAVLFFNSLFLFSLLRAFQYMRRGEPLLERRWMLRAIATLLGIATTRPVMGIFFATSPLTHLEPSQFFGWAFWIGFSINVAVVEWFLRARAGSKAETGTPI